MRDFVRRFSPISEFLIVNFVCFGLLTASALRHFGERTIVVDDGQAIEFLLWETVAGAIAWAFLHARGWRLRDLGLSVDWPLTAIGLLIVVVYIIDLSTIVAIGIAVKVDWPTEMAQVKYTASWLARIGLVLVNPIFQELYLTAYAVRALESRGPILAIAAGALVRGMLHGTQGFAAALSALIFGLFCGAAYWRWRQLWPAVLAHMLFDLTSLAS